MSHTISNYKVIPLGPIVGDFKSAYPGIPFIPIDSVQAARNVFLVPLQGNGPSSLPVVQRTDGIPRALHYSPHEVLSTHLGQTSLLEQTGFGAPGRMFEQWDLQRSLQQQVDRKLAPEIMQVAMFPSTAMRARFEKEVGIANHVIKDGFRACSPRVLQYCIQRLGDSCNLIEKYVDQAIGDLRHQAQLNGHAACIDQKKLELVEKYQGYRVQALQLEGTPGDVPGSINAVMDFDTFVRAEAFRFNDEPYAEEDKIRELQSLRAECRSILQQLRERPAEIRAQQEANTAVFIEQCKNVAYSDQVTLVVEMRNVLRQMKQKLADYLQIKGPAARSVYFKADALEADIIQKELSCAALERQIGESDASIKQLSDGHDLLAKIVTSELLDNEYNQRQCMDSGKLALSKQINLLANSLENQIYEPAYKEQLKGLQDHTNIINNVERSEALAKTLENFEAQKVKNRCGISRYNVPPELVVYLNERHIEPSAFHAIIADPLRVRMFNESIIPLHKVNQKYAFNSTYDAVLQDKMDALAQTTHNAILALHSGDIVQASSCIDAARLIATDILRYEEVKSETTVAPAVAQEDSHLITEGQRQGATQIPIQREVMATTPGGSIPVEAVPAEELKHNLEIAEAFLAEQARQQETLGNTEQAADWNGLHDTLSQVKSLFLKISGLDRFGESLGDQLLIGTAKVARGALVGAAKGGIDFVQGTKQLIFNTQETARELENAIKRLDYFVVRLCSDNPEARNEVRSGIKQFLEAPIEQKAEFLTRLVVSFKIAPELFGKGIGKVLETADTLVGAIGKKITETAKDVISDTNPPIAVTPEGSKVPVQLEGKGKPAIIAEMGGDVDKVGGTTKPGVVVEGIKDQSIITGYTETVVNYDHIFSDKHMKRGIMGLSKLADEKMAKSEIVRIFQSIVKDADSQGLLKAGGTNIITTVINGIEAEIKFDILPDGIVRSFDGYVGRTGRDTWFNMVTWDYKGV